MTFSERTVLLLLVRLNGEEIARVTESDLPCELTPSRQVGPDATVEFVPASGDPHVHLLGDLSGWAHFSIRVHAGRGCQADCVVTPTQTYDPRDLDEGRGSGIRFQPFFLPGAAGNAEALRGKGLFARGLHFAGTVTPGSVRLSCECDECHRSFHVQSFHAGFSNLDYMYSGSGRYTLAIDAGMPGVPGALGTADRAMLARLEAALPAAPDGTEFRYLNPFRCPHCDAAYIDFARFPEQRPGEYYGNHLFGVELLHYPPRTSAKSATPPPAQGGWLRRMLGR